MRSAETSGVGGEGFGRSLRQDGPMSGNGDRARSITPVALAITFAAIVAATLSVGFDYLRTLDEHGARRALVSQIAAPAEALAELVEAEADLTEVARARGHAGGPAHGRQRREEQRREHGDDADDDEQFDQRERGQRSHALKPACTRMNMADHRFSEEPSSRGIVFGGVGTMQRTWVKPGL